MDLSRSSIPDLAGGQLREIPGHNGATCTQANSSACLHGTFVAGILSARREFPRTRHLPQLYSPRPPDFCRNDRGREQMPSATPQELAAAIIECIDAGARVINLSLALAQPSDEGGAGAGGSARSGRQAWRDRGCGGGQSGHPRQFRHHPSSAGSSPSWPVTLRGRPTNESNLGSSIGRRGLGAPGDGITSLSADGPPVTLGGTSVAVPFVTGAIALLWSEFPAATAAQIKLAVTQAASPRRASVVPPLLDACGRLSDLLATNATR